MSHAPAHLAVDGGGTQCRLALVWQGRRYDLTLPGANVTTDFDRAIGVLGSGLSQLSARARIGDGIRDIPAYLALAGVIDGSGAARVAAALPLRTLRVAEDRPAALVGALGAAPGCIAGIGTGSFLGRQWDSGSRFIGGHGAVLGDEASGAWLGRAALAQSLRAVDGIGADSALCIALRDRLGGVPGVIEFAQGADTAAIAALATEVVAAAGRGDRVARGLMAAGASYLVAGLGALGWTDGEKLCLTGGLGPSYASWLPEDMQAALVPAAGSALDGALTLAARLADGKLA